MRKKPKRITKAILETAKEMHETGILDETAYKKITMRHLGEKNIQNLEPMSCDDIRALREKAHVSQAVFANYLNVTVGYISKLERGEREPTGTTLALLNVIRRKGFDAILP